MTIGSGLPKDDVLAAIGRISIRHGQLDHALRMAVKSLTGLTQDEALMATERQMSRELRDRVRKLARKRFGESDTLVKIDAILNKARKVTDKRNELLHGLWGMEIDGGPMLSSSGIAFDAAPSVAELDAAADGLWSVTMELHQARLDGFLKAALEKG